MRKRQLVTAALPLVLACRAAAPPLARPAAAAEPLSAPVPPQEAARQNQSADVAQAPAEATPPQQTAPPTESSVPAGPAGPVRTAPIGPPVRAQFCEAQKDGCWSCAEIEFPRQVPVTACAKPCRGMCVREAERERCLQQQRHCCSGGRCQTPPLASPCPALCGDPDGDKFKNRCLVPTSCPEKEQLADFFGHYRVGSPPQLFEALCGELPKSFPTDHAGGAPVLCGPDNVLWTIHPYTMAKGSRDTGPGLCYGVLRVGRTGQTVRRCGTHHCQTLRYCDGSERAEHCTVIAECDGTQVKPTGLTW